MGRGLIAWATLEAPHGSLSLSRLPSFQAATVGERRRLLRWTLRRPTRYVRPFPSLPFPSFPVLRNRTAKPPNECCVLFVFGSDHGFYLLTSIFLQVDVYTDVLCCPPLLLHSWLGCWSVRCGQLEIWKIANNETAMSQITLQFLLGCYCVCSFSVAFYFIFS